RTTPGWAARRTRATLERNAVASAPEMKQGPADHCSSRTLSGLDRLICHVVHGSLDFIIAERRIATAGRHHALGAGEAFERMLVQDILALCDARAPVVLVARLRCTRHAGSMAERAGLAEDALAEGVFGGWGRCRCRCCGLSCRRCRRRLALATGGERQGGECKHCKSRGIFVHVCFLSAVCS